MITKSALREFTKRIAHETEQGGREAQIRALCVALASEAGAVAGLIALIATESGRKRPSPRQMHSFGLTLELVLESIGVGVARDLPEAPPQAEAAKRSALTLMTSGALRGLALVRVLRLFARAGIPLELPVAEPTAPAGGVEPNYDLDGLADALAGNAFRIQAELCEQASTLPFEVKSGLARSLVDSPDPRLREAAVGWLLDEDPATRTLVSEALRRAAVSGSLSRLTLRRMITMRNWIPADDRPRLDRAILTARQAGIEIEPLGPVAIKGVHVSGFDGFGAQSLVALVRDSRRHAALVAEFHLDSGVRKVVVETGVTLAAGQAVVGTMAKSRGVIAANLDYLRLALPHMLALAAGGGRRPPFALVDVVERLGLPTINPTALGLDDLLTLLTGEMPKSSKTPMAVERALLGSGTWRRKLIFVSSWFEQDPGPPERRPDRHITHPAHLGLILDQMLPARRRWWAEVIAWSALALRAEAPARRLWGDLVLVAAEIRGHRPLHEIPIMTAIAAATVEARSQPHKA
jgi:hypothetical protein